MSLPVTARLLVAAVALAAGPRAAAAQTPPRVTAVRAGILAATRVPDPVVRIRRVGSGGRDSVTGEVFARAPALTRRRDARMPDPAYESWARATRDVVVHLYECRDLVPMGDEEWCRMTPDTRRDWAAALRELEALGVAAPPPPKASGDPPIFCAHSGEPGADVEVETAAGTITYRLWPCGEAPAELARQRALTAAVRALVPWPPPSR